MAKLLQLSTRMLRKLRAAGDITFVRLSSRTIRYAESDITDFIERHTVRERGRASNSRVPTGTRIERKNASRIQAEYENIFRRGKQPKK